jgi:hypothetical protein
MVDVTGIEPATPWLQTSSRNTILLARLALFCVEQVRLGRYSAANGLTSDSSPRRRQNPFLTFTAKPRNGKQGSQPRLFICRRVTGDPTAFISDDRHSSSVQTGCLRGNQFSIFLPKRIPVSNATINSSTADDDLALLSVAVVTLLAISFY